MGRVGVEMRAQINRNADIIKTLPRSISQQVTAHVEKESLKGRRASDIADEIQQMFPESSRAKANLIARTETSKTSTALTQARAEDIGLDWYVWRTSEDGRVRIGHKKMEGVLINWREPPSPEKLAGEKSAGNYHAGNIYNCRCYPQPLITLNDVKFPHKVYINGAIKVLSREQFRQLSGDISQTPAAPPPKPKAAPKVEPPKSPKVVEAPKVEKVFSPANNIKEAENYARTHLNIPNVNLGDFHIEAANDVNRHFARLKESFPEIFSMKKLSSCQTLYNDIYEKELKVRYERAIKIGYDEKRAEELAKRHTKKHKMGANTVALSYSGKDEFEGISFNQKYYKTAKGYEELKKINKEQIDMGFWTESSVKGTITHEFGHQVMAYLKEQNLNTPITQMYNEFTKEIANAGGDKNRYKNLLSQYGSTNENEFFAEAFREYFDSSSPKKYAKKVGEFVEMAFKQLRARR
jgi:SPP1 gp7 family putative phage head morphogenesis protein